MQSMIDFQIVSTSRNNVEAFLNTISDLSLAEIGPEVVDLHGFIPADQLDPHPTAASSQIFSVYGKKTGINGVGLESVTAYLGFKGPALINMSRTLRKQFNLEIPEGALYIEDLCKKYNSAIELWVAYLGDISRFEQLIVTKEGEVWQAQSESISEDDAEEPYYEVAHFEEEDKIWNLKGEGGERITQYWV